MKFHLKTFLSSLAIPLLTGILSSVITGDSMANFSQMAKPPLSPPGFLFPIVWTILYTLMGISSYLIQTSSAHKEATENVMTTYFFQLAVNFLWPIFFFSLEWYLFSFFWLLLLWVLIVKTILSFYPISKTAAYLMIPYLLWVTFAGYLNLGIALLN